MPQIADRKSMARYICVDKGATHPALQREELPKHMSNTSEKILQKTRLIQKKLSSTPPLELFDESVFKELVKKVLISNTAIQFELINGMKLSESRAAT